MLKYLAAAAVALSSSHFSARAGILVDLDATSLPEGALVTWPNAGSVGGNFVREVDTPQVTAVNGVKGVTLDGNNDWYVGPVAPASVTGNNSRSIEAWIYNPAIASEESVFAWARRGGGDGTNMSFNHGTHDAFGAVGQWGNGPDVGWDSIETDNDSLNTGDDQEEAGIWTFIAYTYDGSAGRTSVYTNGSLTRADVNGPLNAWAISTTGGGLPFVVGNQNEANGTRTNALLGSMTIARIRVHDRALAASEIASDFNAAAAVFGRTPLNIPPDISTFTATPSNILLGSASMLAWTVTNADTVAIDQGAVIPNGQSSVAVSPATNTTYTLTATNSQGSSQRTVTVIVDPGPPVANSQSVGTALNVAKAITLMGSDPNTPPQNLVYNLLTQPAHGTLSGSAPSLTYTPTTGFSGFDSFTFRISDGLSNSNTATVSITVTAPPAPPTSITLSQTVVPDGAVAGSFIALLRTNDINFDETHSYQLVAGAGDGQNGLFSISGNQLLAAQTFASLAGTNLSIRVRSTDSGSLSFEQVLAVTVVAKPLGVVINEVHYDAPENLRSEFVELHNPTAVPVNVGGWRFARGMGYTFTANTMIAAGGYLVVAQDLAVFQTRFGFAALGPFSGRLSGESDDLELVDATGALVDAVSYNTEFPWPIGASGDGPSMELIHPSLDNDLGSSWRASQPAAALPELTLIASGNTNWRYRPGSTEASSPVTAWREQAFVEDGSWIPHATPIGYGVVNGVTLAPPLITGMQNVYSSIFLRNTFTIGPGQMPQSLRLRYTVDDGFVLWINGTPVTKRNIADFENAASALANAAGIEGTYYDEIIALPSSFLVTGLNTVAVQVFNQTLPNSDLGFDLEIIRPASTPMVGEPTPGAVNSVFSTTAPPNIRQVNHAPKQPLATEATIITAKVTDPQGVGAVNLLYQIVAPGSFVPARFPRTVPQILADPEGERPANLAFENPANWTTLAMRDDGAGGDEVAADSLFTAVIPAQPHRTLVRYRVNIADLPGTSVRVPFADDPSLNFAYFSYNGVPDYVASTASVHPEGAGHVWPKELLNTLPVYHWLIRSEDMLTLQAYNASEQFTNNGTNAELLARRVYDWEGAFVYNGKVYDHVRARLRGGNSRYGDFDGRFPRGKRHYKFRFNAGNYFQAHDEKGQPYETKWRIFNVGRMFGTKGGNSWGLPEEVGETLWQTFGVPTQRAHWFHFRVIDGAAEAPDQYNGDFWGIQQAQERYDVRFLEARNLPKGNLYKLSDWMFDAERQRRYQSPDMVNDGSEFTNIWNNLHGAQNAAWLNQYVNYPLWYRYNAVAEAIRHYDIFPYIDTTRHGLKNWVWHFVPTGSDPTRGVVNFYPYDWDASWGPSFNNGWDHASNALYGYERFGMNYVDKPEMKIEHRNVLREFRDLIWQPDQVNGLLDDRAAFIAELTKADQDRWRNAPINAGTANDDPLTFKLQDMKNFAFTGWSGASGPTVGAGGRGAYLDAIADNPDSGQLPSRPVITYLGGPTHPTDGISFQTSTFADPQGASTFAGMAWRIGEIEDPTAPAYDPAIDFLLEYTPIWESGVLGNFASQIAVPGSVLRVGHTYRARVRYQDNTGRWSHWSLPYQFTAGAPTALGELQGNLMITEIMYHPANPSAAEQSAGFLDDGVFEYLELRNIHATLSLNLTDVRFTKGIDFNFADGTITTLAPGAYALVVKNRAAFEYRYGTGLPIAGVWAATDSLSNSGERLKLSHGAGTGIHDFDYDDNAPWPTSPDGGGPSLVLADPGTAPDHALAANWRASYQPFGSPGTDDVAGFAGWLASQGETDPNAKPNGGPFTNAMVYALGADLVANPAALFPGGTLQPGAGAERHLVFTYVRRSGAADVMYLVEVGDSFTAWQSGPAVTETLSTLPNGDGTETLTVRILTPVSTVPRLYARLKISIAP